MTEPQTPVSLDAALDFRTLDDGGLSAPVPGYFSNGPSSLAPEKGFPFGACWPLFAPSRCAGDWR